MATRRLFVALHPPEQVRDALLDTMEGVVGARWQDADNLHVTLRFIGEVDRHLFADIVTTLESVPFRPFALRLSDVGHFEGKRRARAIWARVEPSEELRTFQHSVELACRRAGLPPETRKFVPHVTLARLNSGSGDIANWLLANGTFTAPLWNIEQFFLFESDLTPQGALYQKISEFP